MGIFNIIQLFFTLYNQGLIEIYNEYSFQMELGFLFRICLNPEYKVQFERNTSYFNWEIDDSKREIDIAIYSPDLFEKYAIELKYPRNGQYPEQMYKSIKDISFLEKLRNNGFTDSYFIFLTEDHLFYEGRKTENIYQYFRSNEPIRGIIHKPSNLDEFVNINGNYFINWQPLRGRSKYSIVNI